MEVSKKSEEIVSDSEFTNDVKLQKYAGNIYGLTRNGHAMRCPIIAATIIQRIKKPASDIAMLNSDNQQPEIESFEQPKPCNSNCPKFQMKRKPSGESDPDNVHITVELSCSGCLTSHEITEILPYKYKK